MKLPPHGGEEDNEAEDPSPSGAEGEADEVQDSDNKAKQPAPPPPKKAPRLVLIGPAKRGAKTISPKETRSDANQRGPACQNNLLVTQQSLEDIGLRIAHVRYHYPTCLEMGGPIVKKKGEHGRRESKEMHETLCFSLCCAIKYSQPVAIDTPGVRAQHAPSAVTARTKLMSKYQPCVGTLTRMQPPTIGMHPPMSPVALPILPCFAATLHPSNGQPYNTTPIFSTTTLLLLALAQGLYHHPPLHLHSAGLLLFGTQHG